MTLKQSGQFFDVLDKGLLLHHAALDLVVPFVVRSRQLQ
jgi:hypothetical protein